MKGFNSSNASSYIQNINISETNTHKTSIAFTELMSAESEISLPTLSASTYGSPNSLDCSSSDIPSSESPLPCLKSLFPPFQDLGPSDVGRSQVCLVYKIQNTFRFIFAHKPFLFVYISDFSIYIFINLEKLFCRRI